MTIHVKKESSFTKFSYESWVRCGDSQASLFVKYYQLYNARVSIYSDGKSLISKSSRDFTTSTSQWTKLDKSVSLTRNSDSHIEVELTPVDETEDSVADVAVKMMDIPPYTDDCMATKFCMRVFGDNTDPEFEFRNVNDMQLECLDDDTDSMSDSLKAVCAKWLDCLEDVDRELLKNLLTAMLVTASSASTAEAPPSPASTATATEAPSPAPTATEPPQSNAGHTQCESALTAQWQCSHRKVQCLESGALGQVRELHVSYTC